MTEDPRAGAMPPAASPPPEGPLAGIDDPSTLDVADVAARLDVDPDQGLSAAEAAARLARHGQNELTATPPTSGWVRFIAQFADPLIGLLAVAVAIAAAAWIVEGAKGAPIDAIVIAAVIVLNAVIGFVQESRAADAVAALRDMTTAQSTVLRDARLFTVPSTELVPGDVLVLGEGDAVGADARLITATSLRVQEASLTGESEAVEKSSETLPAAVAIGDRRNSVFRGTAIVRGVGRAVVTATGMATQMGSIARMLDQTVEEPTPLDREIRRVGRGLGIAVIAIAIVVMAAVVVTARPDSLSGYVTVLLLGVSLAVAAVPEGLPAILAIVLALGVQRLAKRNAVVKRLSSVETLGSASVICTDKTGTLTRNEMAVERVATASGELALPRLAAADADHMRASTGAGHRAADALHEARIVLIGGSLANNAQVHDEAGRWQVLGDPTEGAFLMAARELDSVTDRITGYSRRDEVPFTSERRLMSTLHEHGDGTVRIFTKGAPDVLLERCTRMQRGHDVVPLDEPERQRIRAAIESMSSQAMRVLGVAWREGHDLQSIDESHESNMVYAGAVGIIDPPRAEVAGAIAEAQRAGVRVVMITGDHPATALRVASDLGISAPGGEALTGADLDALDEEALRDAVHRVSVYARVAPEHKLRIVDALQAAGLVVAMTGDGVNDAPALKTADIGIAMGVTGTEVTKEASNLILADDDFRTIVAAIRQGRVIFDDIGKFLRYMLSSNMGEVLTVLLGVVFAGALGLAGADGTVVLPLLATQVLWINLVTDTGPALAMGVDPEVDDVMARPPRGVGERVIDARMWRAVVRVGLVMAVATLATIDLLLPGGFVDGDQSLDVARSAGFTTLVLAQLFNALSARSATGSAFHRMLTNRLLWVAIVAAVLLQIAVVHVPWLQAAFGTAALDLPQWLLCAGMASIVLWFEEARKLIDRALARGASRSRPPRAVAAAASVAQSEA